MITGYQSEGGIYSGNLLLDRLDANGLQTGERDVGETNDFTIEPMKITSKQKMGHRLENFGDLVEETITGKPQSLKFSLGDNANKKNLAMALFGTDAVVDVAGGAVTDEAVTARLGLEVKLTKMKLDPDTPPVVDVAVPAIWITLTAYALGVFVSKIAGNAYRYECTEAGTSGAGEPTWPTTPGETVEDGTVTWTCRKVTYVEDTDYEIDYTYGMIKALADGDIPEGQALLVDFTNLAYTGYSIVASTLTKIDCLLRLKGKNVANGKACMVEVFKCSLIPTGNIAYITDDYGKLEFTGNIQAVDAGTWKMTGLD